MKKLFLLALTVLMFSSKAQKVVALHSGTTVTMFNGVNPVIDAYNAAANFDTIYIPGGYFNFPGVFGKRLTVIGAGFYPDSTQATGATIANNGFNMNSGADSSEFTGFLVNGDIYMDYWSQIKGVKFRRIRFNNMSTEAYAQQKSGIMLTQCIFHTFNGINNTFFTTISNCIITDGVFGLPSNCLIQNNIFLRDNAVNTNPHLNSVNNCLIQNNVFYNNANSNTINGNNNNVYNNVFAFTPSFGTNNASGNYLNVPQSSILVNAPANTFSYTNNYHLQAPATYLGNDNTQVGLYGGTLGAFKEGILPFNPHIYFKTVAPTTTPTGQLNIQFKVSSQTN